MNILEFLRTPKWARLRRLALVVILVVLGFRNYGKEIINWARTPSGDVVLTRYEFRPELPGAKPAWIIGLKNQSSKFTYDLIELEATYLDANGAVLERDKLLVRQQLAPGEEQLVGSVDFRDRPGAQKGTLTVSKAERVER
jgi:hypothetical protein